MRFVGEGDVTKRTVTMPATADSLKCVKSQPNGFSHPNTNLPFSVIRFTSD